MDLFGIKKRKETKLRLQEEAKKQKEIETKIKIKKTLNNMKSQSAKLESFKKDYIEKARKAALINNKQTYNLAKQGLRLCLSKQRFLDSMVGNFEIAEEMKGITSSIDIARAQAAYDQALANNQGQYEALDAFLREAEDSIEAFTGNENDVSEDELDNLINCQAVDSETEIDDEIESKIGSIRQRMSM